MHAQDTPMGRRMIESPAKRVAIRRETPASGVRIMNCTKALDAKLLLWHRETPEDSVDGGVPQLLAMLTPDERRTLFRMACFADDRDRLTDAEARKRLGLDR